MESENFKNLEKILDEIFIISKADEFGNIIYVNNKFCDFYGYKKKEILGKTFSIIQHPENKDNFYKRIWNKIKNKEIFNGILKHRTKNFKTVYVEQTIVPITDNKDNIKEIIAIGKDISNYVRFTKNISENFFDISIKKKFLEADLLNLFTHELKTPLAGILNFSKLIKKHIERGCSEKSIDKIEELNNYIIENGIILQNYINNFLNMQKLSNSRYEIKIRNFDFNRLMDEIVARFRYVFGGKDILYKNFSSECQIAGDENLIKIIIENILTNALKYSRYRVMISITTSNKWINVVVEDDGPGINEKDKERIFMLFEQLPLKKNKASGHGVGLYLVKIISDLFDYQIDISTSDNLKGTKFTIKILKIPCQ